MIETRIACALLVASIVFSRLNSASAFESNKLYRYDFSGTISTKVADDDRSQYSGAAFSSPVLVKRTGNNELTVKLDQVQISLFNDVIEDLDAHQFEYKPVEQASALALDKPFRIYYEEGSVKSFDTYKEEPKWVTNLKRGLLAFFQIKFVQDSDSQPDSDQFYTTTEKSVFGECDTDYLVLGSNGYLNVTKSRNMAKCKTRFIHRFMPIDSSECYENEKDLQQFKHCNAIFQFNLEGTKQDYVIQQVKLDEQSTFSPFGLKAQTHLVQSKFSMKINKLDQGSVALTVDDGAIRTESLSYDPPEMLNFYANINLESEHYLSNIYQLSSSVEDVLSAFDGLVQEHKLYTSAFEGQSEPGYQEKSTISEKFLKLSKHMGTLNLQKIEQLYNQLDERGEAHKKIFWDVMSVVGTNPSFMFMKKLVTDGDAPAVKIRDFLTKISYHLKMPSKSLFDEYVNLCKSDKIQTNQATKRLCSLPLASLIHQHCAKPHAKYLRMQQEGANATAYKKAQNTCQIATAEEYFSRLVAPSSSASSSSSSGSASSSTSASSDELSIGDKMLNIKMAGELGVKPSIDYLAEILRNKDEHPSLRAAAMWNLKKVSRIYPTQVKRLVVPFYYNQAELLEVRIGAFVNWFHSGMSLHDLETMAKTLENEPSRQLVLYIHSMIESLSKLDSFPCVNNNEKNARQVLPLVEKAAKRHSAAGLFDSRICISSSWLPDFGYGTAQLVSVIMSNESMTPTNIRFSNSEIMSGLKLMPMTVEVQAHGLDKLVKRVFGINGMLADKESFMDIFSLKRRNKRQVSADIIKQEANEIDKELKLDIRDFSDIYISLTVSAYGRPLTFVDTSSRELKKMMSEDGTFKLPQIKKLLHSFSNHTTQRMAISFEKLDLMNNELGLPVYQSIHGFDYSTFKLNSVKLDVEPGFFKDERQGKPPTKIAAALDAKLAKHNEIFFSTGALLMHKKQHFGVGFHKRKLINVPIKMSVDVNLAENRVSVKRQPIHDNLFYVKQFPLSFAKSFDPSQLVNRSSLIEWRPLYDEKNPQQIVPFHLNYMTPLAVGIKVEGKHRAGQDWSLAAWRRYLSQVGLQTAKFMYFFSSNGAPMEARISTVTTEENPTKELTSVFSWKHYHDSNLAELTDIDKQLEKFTEQSSDNRPITVHYKLALLGGSTKERKVELDINYSKSFDRILHKWRAFYQRTPLDQSSPNSEVTNLCWYGDLQFPKQNVEKFLKFDVLDMDHSANMSNQITFGEECTEHKLDDSAAKLAMNVKFDWSQEQREKIEQALKGSNDIEQERKNNLMTLYRRCMKSRENGNLLCGHCVNLMKKIGELLHISAVVDYKDVPERWTKLVSKIGSLYTYARAGYIEEMESKPYGREYKSADGKQDRAHLEANMTTCSLSRKLSYEFDTPNYHVVYKSLPISVPPLSTMPILENSYYTQLKRSPSKQACTLSGQTVSTFDNFSITIPPVGDGCFKLIAKDCSPESNFAVLGAKVGNGNVVKVYIAQKFLIEFVPDKEGNKISDVKVNGDGVTIEPFKKPLTRATNLGPVTEEAFSIENNQLFYTLNSKLYKFSVSTDGRWIRVQQSQYYAGKSCGLCGDSNGDQLLELKSPSNKVCKSTTDFVWSYVLPSTCASRPAVIECA